MEKLKLCLVGCGYLNGIVGEAWKSGLLPEYEIVGVMGRSLEKAEKLANDLGCQLCHNQEELLNLYPDYIAEAASIECLKKLAVPALEQKTSLVVLSIGVFADGEFLADVQEAARKSGAKVHIASGAIGGFDVLRTITLMSHAEQKILTAGIETRKGPKSLMNTPLFKENLMEDGNPTQVLSGNAKEAIGLLPTKVNVAVAASLATAGVEETSVNIFSVPGMVGDDHKITAEIEGVKTVVDTYSSTSAIAGWSVVEVLQNIVSPIMFG